MANGLCKILSVKTEDRADRAIINILTFPFEIMRVWTAFIDKIKQKLNSKYLDSVIEELAIRLEKLQHPQQILKRRRNLYYITKSMNLPSGRTYPSFCIAKLSIASIGHLVKVKLSILQHQEAGSLSRNYKTVSN